MKIHDSSNSSNSDDIDLDEIAKMIAPLDDLEKNLFSAQPVTNTTSAPRIPSPKKGSSHKEKPEEIGDDEAEVLTSFSSNNGQGKSETLGKSWSKNLEGDGAIGGEKNFNAPARARRRDAKFGNGAEGAEFAASSNLDAGLWSGDDLWKLNGDKISYPSESKVSTMPDLKSSLGVSKGKNTSGQPTGMTIKGGKKPGKFDWLGLLDDDSEDEKGESAGNKYQRTSKDITSNASKEFHPIDKSERVDANLTNLDHDHSQVSKGSLGVTKETNANENDSHEIESKGKLNKISLSENLSSKRGDLKGSGSDNLLSRKSESKSITSKGKMKDEGKVTKLSEVLMTNENDHMDVLGLFDGGRERAKSRGDVMGEVSERKEGNPEAPFVPKRRSLLEEDERSSHSYAPTFLGGSPEGTGRRRRKREGAEGLPSRSTLNPASDPLGLFSLDDNSSKVEDTSKRKAPLPDWLTGMGGKNVSTVKEADPHLDGMAVDEAVKVVDGQKYLKGEDRVSKKAPHGKESKEDDMELSNELIKISSEPKEMENKSQDGLNPKESIAKDSTANVLEKSKKVDDSSPFPNVSQAEESEHRSEMSSRRDSDESLHQIPIHSTSRTKGSDAVTKISKVDEISPRSKDNFTIRRNEIKNNEKYSRKHHSSTKPKAKKNPQREKVINEQPELSSASERADSRYDDTREFALLERQYMRKVRELEEQIGQTEQLEGELAKMRYLEGEVEHLRTVVHVLELEKSAAEVLVDSLQAKHSEQLKRLEDVHRTEVETLSKALLREEKRGAEEVKRLVEDHRKTLDRLMDANIKLEEEFRTRMLEARRDWGRDVEAMRLAYQQSNNAAITNASLAVLTGHTLGAETKDKSEDDPKDESFTKTITQCPQEVKELSQTVERVESILTQALEVMLPKAKVQTAEMPIPEQEVKMKMDSPMASGIMKRQRKSMRTKRRPRISKSLTSSRKVMDKYGKKEKWSEQSESSEEEEESVGNRSHGIESRVGTQKVEITVESDTGNKIPRHDSSKGMADTRRNNFCGECRCCQRNFKGLQQHTSGSNSAPDSHGPWDKCDKEDHNMRFHYRGDSQHWRNRKKMFSWKDEIDHSKSYHWNQDNWHKHSEQDLYTMSDGILPSRNHFSTSRQSDVIIDPKAYLLRLATANINNLFQPSVMTSA